MASALATGALDAYFVGEPFAAQTLKSGDARRLHTVEELWEGFICNLVVVRQEMIDRDPRAVRLLVQGAVRAGLWAAANLPAAAEIAAGYWNQPLDVVAYALNTPPHRVVFHRYTPKASEMQAIADLMQRHGLIPDRAIDGLVESRFAEEADTTRITGLESILPAG
jgi:NitT/TauT family transport system substrate-binding protein